MSFLDSLRAVRQTKQVAKHTFLTKISKGTKSIHVFMEGKTDIGFYGSIIAKETKGYRINTHVCGNKDEVYATKDETSDKEDSDNILLFFVDKDLDDIIPVARSNCHLTHVTNTYSIESYFLNAEIFHKYFCDVFKMPYQSQEVDMIAKKLSEVDKKACITLTKIMSWIVLARRDGNLLDLSRVKMSDIFDIDDSLDLSVKLTDVDLLCYLREKTGLQFVASIKQLEEVISSLERLDSRSYIRGKFHSWIFVRFTDNARKCLEKAIGQRVKQTTTLTESNLVELFSSRIETPSTIKTFIERRLSVA